MKRAAVVGFLALCLAGVVYLLMETSRDRAGRRGGLDDRGNGRAGATSSHADPDAGDGDATDAEAAPVDDDANRVEGPDQRVRGRVLHDGAGVPGATVTLLRAHPLDGDRLGEPPPPIVTGKTGDAGRFELVMPRRSRVVVQAAAPGLGFVRRLVFLPAEGDPDELVLVLTDGHACEVLVVDTDDAPIADALVKLRTNTQRLPPLGREARTDETGRHRFEDLGGGNYSFYVEAEGYPHVHRNVNLPAQTHVRFVLAPGGTVFGTVRTHDGAPLAGAAVVLNTTDDTTWQYGTVKATTDANGAYRATNLAAGYVSSVLVVSPAVGGRHSVSQRPLEPLEPGAELEFDILLPPGAPATGKTVLADSGAPVAGARVALLRMNESYRSLSEVAHVASGPDGAFEFPFVVEGTYALEATGENLARRVVRWSGQRPLTIDFYADGVDSPPPQRVEMNGTGGVRAKAPGFDYDTARRANFNLQGTDVPVTADIDDTGTALFLHVPPSPAATVRTYNPPLESDPFAVRVGEVTDVTVAAADGGDFVGVVVDERGAPIAGAYVQAFPDARIKNEIQTFLGGGNTWAAARSDAEGRYHHTLQSYLRQSYAAQAFTLAAFADGFVATFVPDLKLPPEGESVTRRIVLRRGGTIAGRARFADGRPATGLLVSAVPTHMPDAPHATRATRRAYTDFDGRFAIEGVADGAYHVTAFHGEGRTEAVEAQAGATEVELVIEPTASIGGFVVDEDGAPVTRGRVAAIVPGAGGKESKRYGALRGGGRFQIQHLDPGAYAIEVSPQASWGTSPSFLTKRTAPVQTGTLDVLIEVESGAVLEGKVRGAAGKPVPGAGVIAMPVELSAKERNNAWNIARPTAIANGRGEFRIKGVGENEVELLALAPGHLPTTMRANPGGAPVEIRLERGAVLEMRFLQPDGKPLTGQWFNVQPVDQAVQQTITDLWQRAGQTYNTLGGWQLQGGTTGADGKARLASLFPGEYRLVMQPTAGAVPATTVRTDAGLQTVRLIEPLGVRGRVTDTAGQPIVPQGDSPVWVNARDSNGMTRSASVGADGAFRITGLAPGAVKVQAWANGYKPASVDAVAGDYDIAIQMEKR